MKKVVISILGEDRPGIVHAVSKALCDLACNILEVSQTILQTEFAGIFIVSMPEELTQERMQETLREALDPIGISAFIKDYKPSGGLFVEETEPFVVSLTGEDQLGIIPGIAGVISGFNVNIESLKAISRSDGSGVVLVFEVAVPRDVHRPAFREALRWKAEEFSMELSVQHRDIFEAIHRI